jgi:hypothetical protein
MMAQEPIPIRALAQHPQGVGAFGSSFVFFSSGALRAKKS